MTWYDVKLGALQKMFATDGTDISVNDDSTKEYLNAMPQAANECMEMICTAGRYLRKSYTVEKESGAVLSVNVTEALTNFWNGSPVEVYKLTDGVPEQVDGVELIAGEYLIFPKDYEGTFKIYYDAKPELITLTTEDTAVIDLPDDAAVLLPLYIASQLYKDDDITIATYYRNEFEAAFERLKNPVRHGGKECFSSVTGWW